MFHYKHHPMTERDKDGVLISLVVRDMVEFRKIMDQRKLQCTSQKWQEILKEIETDVLDGFHTSVSVQFVKRVRQYTHELKAMDVCEFFAPPVPEPVVAKDRRQLEQEFLLGHPEGERFYSFRRNGRLRRGGNSGERKVMDSFRKATTVAAMT